MGHQALGQRPGDANYPWYAYVTVSHGDTWERGCTPRRMEWSRLSPKPLTGKDWADPVNKQTISKQLDSSKTGPPTRWGEERDQSPTD